MLFLGLAVMVVNAQVSVAEIYDDQYYCPDYHPQKTLDVERVGDITVRHAWIPFFIF